jgi:hypothetical protein
LDGSFNPGVGYTVNSLAVLVDGNILVGGDFNTLGGQTHNYLGRLITTQPATQSLAYDGASITWLRGGTSPEVWRTTFDYSCDGLSWTPLGEGSRLLGGWVRRAAVVPPDAVIRARGYTVGGFGNASSWFVESLWTNAVAPRPRLLVESVNGPVIRFSLAGAPDARCAVQTTTNLSLPTAWDIFTDLTLTNGRAVFEWTNSGEPGRFFRAVGP